MKPTERRRHAIWLEILKHYLETGKGMCVSDLAKRQAVTKSTISRDLNAHGIDRWMTKITWEERSKENYSRMYPGLQIGSVNYRVYLPTRDALRELLRQMTGCDTDACVRKAWLEEVAT